MTPCVAVSFVFAVVLVARVSMTDGTRAPSGDQAPPGDQRITTSRDGCRIQPAGDGVGVNVDCSGLRLAHIPGDLPTDMGRLRMRRNNITRLDGRPFERYTELTSLDLSRNDLVMIGANVFSDVRRLEELDLTYNKLCMNNDTFPVRLFSGITSLRRLTMTSNACNTQHAEYPDTALAKLTNLEFLSLTGIPTHALGEGFGRLTNLKTLVFAGRGCKMLVLRNITFDSLRNVSLSHLSLKACHLKIIEAGALEPLSHLKTLNLACNHDVGFDNIYTAIITAENMKLKTLVVDDVTPSIMSLVDEQFAHNAFTDIERISMRANYIIQVDVRKLQPLKKITHFNLGYNAIASMLPNVNSTVVLFTTLFSLNIDVIDISDIFTSMSTYRERYCFREAKSDEEDPTDPTEYFFREPPHYDDLDYNRVRPAAKLSARDMTREKEQERVTIPPSVQVVYADHIYPIHAARETAHLIASVENDVVVMNVSYNPFTAIGPIRGLHRCQVVDFRQCAIETISPGALSDMRMLKYLYLMGNRIGKNGRNLKGAFDGLSSLEVLDLSENAIYQIHASAFSRLTSLRVLSLCGNQLTSISFDISGLRHLDTINLANNNINRIHPNFTNAVKRRQVHVVIHGNPIVTSVGKSYKNLAIGVSVGCGVAVMVALALVVIVVRRHRSCNQLGNVTRREDEDDDLLRRDEFLDNMDPDLSAAEPDSSAHGEQNPGEMQLRVQSRGQCDDN